MNRNNSNRDSGNRSGSNRDNSNRGYIIEIVAIEFIMILVIDGYYDDI